MRNLNIFSNMSKGHQNLPTSPNSLPPLNSPKKRRGRKPGLKKSMPLKSRNSKINTNNVYFNTSHPTSPYSEGNSPMSPDSPSGLDPIASMDRVYGGSQNFMGRGMCDFLGADHCEGGRRNKSLMTALRDDTSLSKNFDAADHEILEEAAQHSADGKNERGIRRKYLNEQQYKMFQSVKMMQQNNPVKIPIDYSQSFSPTTSPSITPVTPIWANNISEHNFNAMEQTFRNGNAKDDGRINENLNRSYFVRKCADELLRIKPRYQMALKNLAINGLEETKVISQTVRLYSQILCNWKKQTLYIYSKMSASIAALHKAMEGESTRHHYVAMNYQSNIGAALRRNEQLEMSLKALHNDPKMLAQAEKDKDDGRLLEANEKLKAALLEKDRIIQGFYAKMNELLGQHHKALEENEQLRAAVAPRRNDPEGKVKVLEVEVGETVCKTEPGRRPESNLDCSIKSVKDLIDKIRMIKNHQNILCLNDAKNLNSPIIKPEITIICEKLKHHSRALSEELEDEKLIENYLSKEENVSQKPKPHKDGIEIESIIDRRVSPDGKIQFYVSCPVAANASVSPSSPSSSPLEDRGELPNFIEKVWVEEKNLVGCEGLIKNFFTSQQMVPGDVGTL